ncbi:hypothetical protein I3842_12G050200 [Carya illinoinensis]|uniref:Agenet domain-containing protein n=1 Tax=Carya illinoinensis TaxID=32201 RepID=A0A922DGY7_CARIL|nr:hypothetical protein I3842_12G050200 [Carya illinoinensis]
MDYDDNEFQSQNLHLTGEGSTKFPPVLLPYALPKFDFDDSLQGHLRFDSLVETEVFLGIESNEDNQWIEDFSRGSSGIEFNPSATESCTIARRNNVWSEATSSESVEMLLKSVGQEEVILRQTIVKESDACDELGCLAKQMEPNPVHDNNISRTVDVTNLQSTLLQNEIPENSSGLKGDVPEEQPHAEDTSLSHEVALSVGGTSGELDTNSINRSDVDTLAEEYLSDKTRKDSSDSAMQVGSIVVYTEDIIARGSEVNNEDLLHQFDDLSSMNSNGVETGNDGIEEEFNLLSREAEIADQNLNRDIVESSTSHSESHLGLTSKLEYVEEGNATGNRTSNVAEPSSMVDNSDSDLHVAERCLEDVGIRIPDEARKHDLVLVKDTDVCDPSKVNTQEVSPLTIKDDTNHEGYAVQVRNFKVLLTHGQESPGEKNDLLESGCKLDNEMLASKSEALLLSMENREVSNVEGDPNNNSHEGGTSSVALVCSSPQLLKETHETESLKEIHNGFGVSREDLITEDHVLSSTGNESSQTCGEEKIQGKSGVPEGDIDVSVSANESTELPSNFSSVVGGSLIIDKGVGSSFFCEESTGNEPIMSKLQFDANVGNESASNAILENAKVASSDTMSGVLLPSDNGVTTDGVIDCREVQMTASVVGYTHSDKKEPPATKISTDESISILMESSEVENELGPVSETEKDASGKVSQETVDGSLPMAESCNAESQSEAQMAVTGGVNQECPRRMEVHAVSSDIATEVGDFENTPSKVSGDVYKVHEGSLSSALLPESQNDLCALESVSASANVDKHTCSPNITRATEQSQRENENEQEKASKEEGINGPTDQNAPVSEVIDVDASNILPISGDPKRNETFEQEQNFTFEISSLADLSRKDTAKNSQPFPFMHAGKVTPIVEGSPSTTGLVPMEAKISREISHGSPQVSEGQITRGGKSSGERKTRRRSGKATGKETAKKGNHAKETTPARQSERGDKSTNVSVSPSAIFQFVQSSEMQHYGHVEGSNTKPIFVLTASTSNLPDLNTSASPSTMFQQPFTDLQQVQLRAQIFVYGALIQGTVPEEAHMISAFGGPDGGKSIWENAWRASAERLHIHKSQPITPETPLQLRPGVRALEQAIKQNVFQSKGISSPLGRTSSKGIPTVVNSVVALSSPLWSIPTPCDALQSSVMPRGSVMDYQQALSPLHPYQTSPVRNFVGHNTSWIPQVPFPGPGGYWKGSRDSSELVLKASNMNREELNRDSVRGGPDTSTKHSKEGRLDKKVAQSTTLEKSPITTEMPKGSMEDHMRLADGISGIVMANEKDSRGQKGRRALDLAKTIGVVPESEIGSRPSITIQNEYEKAAENFKLSCIKEGSLVEVLKSTDGFKAAWFTANVLNLDDGKAYVSYTELQTDNGEGQLKEYVALQGEGDKPPRIRPARTVTALQYEGTRKRRRAAMGDYNWSVGDRVDALIEDSWREGVVTEKNKKDETALNVHFPVHGETSVVRAWHLRPSLIWKDGEWVEWSNLRENVRTSLEDDTPKEKRVKLGGPVTEAKGKDKVFKSRSVVESGKLEESRLLDLSATDKIFNIGKNSRNENKPDALRTLRSGLQKERSKVIFGVPKPGKKRKFMEVSKHYVVDQSNKITEANDSVKFQKYTMPRGSGSRGWKNSSKNDLKEKQRAETKPRALKSGKAQSLSERIIPAKDNLLNAVSAPDDATLADLSAKDKDSTSNAENTSGKNNKLEIGSLSSVEGTTEGPLLFSSLAPSSDGSSKKVSTSNAKSVRANKGKIAPAGGKLARIEEEKVFNGNPAKSASEVVEPRRSNRRIQPTSRLLEGLQSSLTISKIPSVSHDKGHKSLIRTASRGSNQG